MKEKPARVFLDTNIFILGAADPHSPEFEVLRWAGFGQDAPGPVEVIVSEELFDQIARVAKRLRHKDWSGELLGRIWQQLQVRYVILDPTELAAWEIAGDIPREDVGVYLTARAGDAQCFVSANHKLIRVLAARTGEFECLTPEEFVAQYLR
jgi:predicted nucleic acid-binding protein